MWKYAKLPGTFNDNKWCGMPFLIYLEYKLHGQIFVLTEVIQQSQGRKNRKLSKSGASRSMRKNRKVREAMR